MFMKWKEEGNDKIVWGFFSIASGFGGRKGRQTREIVHWNSSREKTGNMDGRNDATRLLKPPAWLIFWRVHFHGQ